MSELIFNYALYLAFYKDVAEILLFIISGLAM